MKNKNRKIVVCISIFALVIIATSSLMINKIFDYGASASEKIENLKDYEEKDKYVMSKSKIKFTNRENTHKDNRGLIFNVQKEFQINNMGMKYQSETSVKNRPDFNFGTGKYYSDLEGVSCFRGNNMRDGASYGLVSVKEEKLKIKWKKNIGAIGSWTGVGWNGQPAIVKWKNDIINNMNINDSKKNKKYLTEVIYGTMDGNVYFLDLEDGMDTREKLKIGAPIKGSVTVDPRGFPLLYVGQGIECSSNVYLNFAYRIFSLVDFTKLYEIKGADTFAKRQWGAFDSTSLIDKEKDYIFICGENGVVYSGKLNTEYNGKNIKINPEIQKYSYDVSSKNIKGIENSIAIYNNYGFFADNDGILQCLDLKTLKPVWSEDVYDDTDSTIVLESKNSQLSLYTACEVDHQGKGGFCYIRKIDGLSGRVIWQNKYVCDYDAEVNGGAFATPILGKKDIDNLIIFNIARCPSYNEGMLVAFDKYTGKEVWKLKLDNYCWSSPVDLYTVDGKSYIVQCDSAGKTMLIKGMNGKILDTLELGSNVEGSPAAFENTLVVGTRGGKIIGFTIN